MLGRPNVPVLHGLASQLFERALPAILETTEPRSWAFAILGIHEYLQRFGGDRMANQVYNQLAERLLKLYQSHCTPDWRWFEDKLTYCNADLSHAMLLSGQWLSNPEMKEAGLDSLNWLAGIQRDDSKNGHFVPIGSSGWYPRGGERARFDQQPVEVQSTVSACLEAYRITGDPVWRKEANRAFEWFLGRNDLNIPLYDALSGGCRDGLHSDRPNENQGAESTLAFLQALLELRLAETPLQPVGVLVA